MKTIIYYLSNQGVNWSIIWSDCSIYVCIWLLLLLALSFWLVKNYNESIKNEYLIRTTGKLASLQLVIDELTAKNNDFQEKLNQAVRKRDEKGHFLISSGRGHGKKKVLIL